MQIFITAYQSALFKEFFYFIENSIKKFVVEKILVCLRNQ